MEERTGAWWQPWKESPGQDTPKMHELSTLAMVALLALLSQLAASCKDPLAHATGNFLVSGPGQGSCSPPPSLPTSPRPTKPTR